MFIVRYCLEMCFVRGLSHLFHFAAWLILFHLGIRREGRCEDLR